MKIADSDHYRIINEIESLKQILALEPNHTVALEMLVWNLQYAGYFREALEMAGRAADMDPLSPNAQFNLSTAQYTVGYLDQSLATAELADQLGSVWAKANISVVHYLQQNDELGIASEEAHLRERGLPYAWLRESRVKASIPATGQAYLDKRIPEIVATVAPEQVYEMTNYLHGAYLAFGFLDRYFELIFESGISSELWSDSENLIAIGTFDRATGFTAHPRYLEIAKTLGLIELWEKDGPPDFCKKADGDWVCE
jgi:tetratricopeptide (TPR) repeat protein